MIRGSLAGVSAFALAMSLGAVASAAKPEMAKLGDALAAMYEGTKTAAEPGADAEVSREDLSRGAAPACAGARRSLHGAANRGRICRHRRRRRRQRR
jgi:hypothetical protein